MRPLLIHATLFTLCSLIGTVFLRTELQIAGTFGGALDDTWIHYVIARNFAIGQGWTFNPGVPTGASTAPLYTFLLAIGYYVFGNAILWSKLIGITALGITGIAVVELTRWLGGDTATAVSVGVLTILSPSLQWAACSGMEITTYLALAMSGLWLILARRPSWGILLLALSVWCRPDGGWLLGLSFLAIPRRQWVGAILIAVIVVVPYFGFNYAMTGALFPSTVGAKSGFSFSWTHTSRWVVELLNLCGMPFRKYEINHPILLLPLLAIGAILTWRRTWMLTLYLISFLLIFSLFYPNASSHQRYLLPVLPPILLLVVLGLRGLLRWRAAFIVAASLLLIWTATLLPGKAMILGWNVQNINTMHVTLGKWINENTEATDIIAVNDVGAIGYHADRRIVDLCGLVTPQMSFWENIETHRPDYVVIYPGWFIQEVNSKRFQQAYRPVIGVELMHNTVASRPFMLVFGRYR